MTSFVDPRDPQAVEAVLRAALPVVGVAGVLQQLTAVPGLTVRLPERGRLLRGAVPGVAAYGDRALRLEESGRGQLEHVVGGVVLARDDVPPVRLAGVLAALVTRSLDDSGADDDVSVLLTSLRDAVAAAT